MYRLCICRSHRVYTEYSTSIIITTQDGNRYAKQKSQLSQKGRATVSNLERSLLLFIYLFIWKQTTKDRNRPLSRHENEVKAKTNM